MHIAAMSPLCISSDGLEAAEVEKQREVFVTELKEQGKPEDIIEKIVEGKMSKYYEEVCLLNQPFIKDEDISVGDLITQKIAVLGEKIEIGKFERFEISK